MILALDLGLHTGWAYDVGPRVHHGRLNLTRYDSWAERYHTFRDWFEAMLRLADKLTPARAVEQVGFENAFQKGAEAARVFGGFRAILLERCWANKITPKAVHPSVLKKLATGSPKASKAEMIKKAQQVLSHANGSLWPGMSSDEADAICLLHVLNRGEVETWEHNRRRFSPGV